jgi:hypothetical protein
MAYYDDAELTALMGTSPVTAPYRPPELDDDELVLATELTPRTAFNWRLNTLRAGMLLAEDYAKAKASDVGGILHWHATGRAAEALAASEPKPRVSTAKPAISGLGVTAPEDHRLGRWKA